ncbi:hypothetical protein DMH88_18990 [Escherichia coli]|nr:hypothetical protein [Escherichia coli]
MGFVASRAYTYASDIAPIIEIIQPQIAIPPILARFEVIMQYRSPSYYLATTPVQANSPIFLAELMLFS